MREYLMGSSPLKNSCRGIDDFYGRRRFVIDAVPIFRRAEIGHMCVLLLRGKHQGREEARPENNG